MKGWVKLHRDLFDGLIWKLPDAQRIVFFTIILLASHNQNEWLWKGQRFVVQPGQLVTSLDSLATRARVSVKSVRTALVNLEKLDFLANESASTGRLITIKKWAFYQSRDEDAAIESTIDRQSIGKASATTKKNKNATMKELLTPFGEIMECWNSNRGVMPAIREVDAKRQRSVKTLWIKNPSIEWFRKLFQTAASSDFLCGRTDKPFVAGFDFVIKNAIKIFEGTYANRTAKLGYKPSEQDWSKNQL